MTKLYGVLHDAATGEEILRQVRILKVSFGIPKGADVHVWIDGQGQWCIQPGLARKDGPYQKEVFEARAKAEVRYVELRKDFQKLVAAAKDPNSVMRSFPRKIPYFTFHRLGMDGDYVADFDAIEMHGTTPSEIDIVFLSDDPLDAAYHWFTQTRLCCHGDGKTAKRHLDAAQAGDKAAAKGAAEKGEQWFTVEKCCVDGCPLSKATAGKDNKEYPPKCKPHGRLHFQLVNQPRFGGTVTYDTTGYRSISQLYSCIQQIKSVTGRGNAANGFIAGIPLKLILRPYKLLHNGIQGVQFGVSLEFRASSAVELNRLLIRQGQEFRAALELPRPAQRQIEAPTEPVEPEVIEPDDFGADPAAMEAEFYPDEEPDYDEGDPGPGDDSQAPAAAGAPAKEGKN